MYKTVKIEKDENFAKYIKEQWKRFLDDCFIFWERSMTDFTYFESVLNSLHPDIKFKVQKSAEKLPFFGYNGDKMWDFYNNGHLLQKH